MVKATYGTGSSIMMNVGEKPIFSDKGVVTSLAWSLSGKVNYVLEGNINYTGAVITWLQKDLGLIASAKETEELAKSAIREILPILYQHLQVSAPLTGTVKRKLLSAESLAQQVRQSW